MTPEHSSIPNHLRGETVPNLIERLLSRAGELSRASATDEKDRYMNVVARLSREDGELMREAANEIAALKSRIEIPTPTHRTAGETIGGGEAVIKECLRVALRSDHADAPFPLDEEQANIWHTGRATAFRHALEMMAPASPPPVEPAPGVVSQVMVDAALDAWIKTRLRTAENHRAAMHAAITAALAAAPEGKGGVS